MPPEPLADQRSCDDDGAARNSGTFSTSVSGAQGAGAGAADMQGAQGSPGRGETHYCYFLDTLFIFYLFITKSTLM